MPFSSQFALSLELTRAIPAAGVAAAATGAALVKLARALRDSGSDIVIEEDLAAIFRQNRIDPKFEKTFRQAVTTETRLSTIVDSLPIVIQSGPGITVGRALSDPDYLPFVIQVSLLCAVHELETLCDGMEEALRLRAIGSENYSTPKSDAMLGTFRAISDQTSQFIWMSLLQDVGAALGFPHFLGPSKLLGLTVPLLQACLDMLAAVQRLYKDSIMKIDGQEGSFTVIVWAHHILGLTVHVMNTRNGTVKFGNGVPSVLIEFPETGNSKQDSIAYLLDAQDNIQLKIGPIYDENVVELIAEPRFPLLGYAITALSSSGLILEYDDIKTLCHFSAALAYVLADNSYLDDRFSYGRLHLPRRDMEQVAKLVLGDCYDKPQVTSLYRVLCVRFNKLCATDGFHLKSKSGELLDDILGKMSVEDKALIFDDVVDLARLIVALSAAGDFGKWQKITMASLGCGKGYQSGLYVKMGHRILLEPSGFFKVIAVYLRGRNGVPALFERSSTMISAYGWTVFKDAIHDFAPYEINPWRLWIQPGTLYSDGRIAHSVLDGVDNSEFELPCAQVKHVEGEMLQPQSAIEVSSDRFLVAHRNDTFLVSRRYRLSNQQSFIAIGLSAFHNARWDATVIPDDCSRLLARPSYSEW
ncbi:hypothetical protein BS50DRAFT_633447 [Corynespora cassiicola Philippines]|uniref:Uncharacterized protein n=1 Tax=Corynespora cassiicola Philippines TaxID=1448308 RepID=A0A2T2NQP0_CORCC|nr:hypothetical protein BS50DRAFT_633447 [Corynespora cassiicola Philippines]